MHWNGERQPHKDILWAKVLIFQGTNPIFDEGSLSYINTYDSKPVTLDALVEKLMTGEEAFKGKDPIGAFCGIFDTHI